MLRRLLEFLTADRSTHTMREHHETHIRIIEHRSNTVLAMGAEQDLVSQVAQSLGLPVAEVEQLLRLESGRRILADLAAGNTAASAGTAEPAPLPALRVECGGCHRTVARGRGICVYCGTDLPLEAHEPAPVRTLQQSVDAQYVPSALPAAGQAPPPQAEATPEEQLAFLRRLSHM
jgi:hypothetical protein